MAHVLHSQGCVQLSASQQVWPRAESECTGNGLRASLHLIVGWVCSRRVALNRPASIERFPGSSLLAHMRSGNC
jgi:hypothetical protein